jgi:peptidoglycan/xylan/chitin deacetylase (PgdA/CDA1 family)
MILPKPLNNTYLFARKYYLDIAGKVATPQYGIHILNGHYLAQHNNASTEMLYDTLFQLSKEVDFVSFQEGSERVKSKQILTTEKLVCFSFDDGYEECFNKIKPVLDAFSIKAGFFICPNFVEGTPQYIADFLSQNVFLKTNKQPMSWVQIKTLHDEGHLIGSHTLNHINCKNASLDVLDFELKDSKRRIEEQLQAPCLHFAYPYGKIEHFSEQALACAEKYFTYIYSQAGHRNYFSYNERVINRRHFEGNWAKKHIVYYLNKKRLN